MFPSDVLAESTISMGTSNLRTRVTDDEGTQTWMWMALPPLSNQEGLKLQAQNIQTCSHAYMSPLIQIWGLCEALLVRIFVFFSIPHSPHVSFPLPTASWSELLPTRCLGILISLTYLPLCTSRPFGRWFRGNLWLIYGPRENNLHFMTQKSVNPDQRFSI